MNTILNIHIEEFLCEEDIHDSLDLLGEDYICTTSHRSAVLNLEEYANEKRIFWIQKTEYDGIPYLQLYEVLYD